MLLLRDIVKAQNRVIRSQDVATIDGIDYQIGPWIRTNLTAFRHNKLNEVRLNLLRVEPIIHDKPLVIMLTHSCQPRESVALQMVIPLTNSV